MNKVTKEVTVRFKGWFYFCPIWTEEDPESTGVFSPIPRWNLWALLDAALFFQQCINWLLFHLADPSGESGGFVCLLLPLSTPRTITLRYREYPEASGEINSDSLS